jgi:hypothetical protein
MIEARPQKTMIPVEESFAAWRQDPKYVEAFTALEDEFWLATAMIQARREPDAGNAAGRRRDCD